jgi:hypothetical protein
MQVRQPVQLHEKRPTQEFLMGVRDDFFLNLDNRTHALSGPVFDAVKLAADASTEQEVEVIAGIRKRDHDNSREL